MDIKKNVQILMIFSFCQFVLQFLKYKSYLLFHLDEIIYFRRAPDIF